LEENCIKTKDLLLCNECIKADHANHSFHAISYVFGDEFLEDINEYASHRLTEGGTTSKRY
jgi:hypothetical protein